MGIVKINEKVTFGISIRTTNENKMNSKTAKIGKTWQRFDHEVDVNVDVDYQGGERVYGVY